jgi:hypothetical protein
MTRLRVIERTGLVIAAVVTAGSVLFWRAPVTLGVGLGAGLSVLNLHALRRVSGWVIASTSRRKQALLMTLLALKMAALIGLVYLIVRYAPVNVIAFVVGLSALVGAIFIGSLGPGEDDAGPAPKRRRPRAPRPAAALLPPEET